MSRISQTNPHIAEIAAIGDRLRADRERFKNSAPPESSYHWVVSPQVEARIGALEAKLDEVAVTTRKLYKIFLWTAIVPIAAIVLPLLFAVIALPAILSGFGDITSSCGDLLQ